MFKFGYSGLAAATIAAAIASAFAQQPSTSPSEAASSASPIGATPQIQAPRDGDLVTSPFKVQLTSRPGMGTASASVGNANADHPDLLIDTTLTGEDMTRPIKSDAQHIRFRKDQIAAMATLPPGKHTLQFVLTNANDVPLQPLVQSEVVTVTVKDANARAPAANLETKEAAAAKDAENAKKAMEAKQAAEAKEAMEAKQAKEAEDARQALAKQAERAQLAEQAQLTKEAQLAKEAQQALEAKPAKPDKQASVTPNVKPVKARRARSAMAAHPKTALNKPMVLHPEPHRLHRHCRLHQRHHYAHARHHQPHHGDATPHRHYHAHQHHQKHHHPQKHRHHEHHPSHHGDHHHPNQVSNK
jgi:hypothetical protein